MREEDGSNWFSKWEEELPSPEELTPISQTLITRDLALAFDIQTPNPHSNFNSPNQFLHHIHHRSSQIPVTPPTPVPAHLPNSGDFDSSSAELGGGGSGGGGGGIDEPARTLKRPRLVWTPQLHKRFVDAVAHLGIKNAVPKTIMQLMSVDGLTRENVASHLQKYRLYLKRMQGINNGGGGAAVSGGGSGDAATDHLFASSPVPAHLLGGGGGGRTNSEHFMGYVSPAALHHQQQVAAMVAGGQYHHHLHNRQMGHFGSPTSGGGGGQFEHPFLARQAQVGGRLGGGGGGGAVLQNSGHGYVEDVELSTPANGRKVLTLFPAADD